MTAIDFYKEFTKRTREDLICDDGRTLFEKYKSNSDFTPAVTRIINGIIDDYVDNGIHYTHQNEYFRIDSVGWVSNYRIMKDDADRENIGLNAHLWDLKVAVEHENSKTDWTDEIAKLIHVKCPLKVVIAYNYSDEREEIEQCKLDFVAKWMQKIAAFTVGCNEEEYLLVLGNGCNHKTGKSDYDRFDYRGYLFNWKRNKFIRIIL